MREEGERAAERQSDGQGERCRKREEWAKRMRKGKRRGMHKERNG